MARGYPDYFGQSIWPKYGTAHAISSVMTIGAGTNKKVIDISVQGVLTCFKVYVSGSARMDDVVAFFNVDGVLLDDLYFNKLSLAPTIFNPRSFRYLSYFNGDITEVVFMNGVEIPFHDTFIIQVNNGEAFSIGATVSGIYYVVT